MQVLFKGGSYMRKYGSLFVKTYFVLLILQDMRSDMSGGAAHREEAVNFEKFERKLVGVA